MKRLTLLTSLMVCIACANSASLTVLTTLDKVTSDTTCPAGGVTISTGKDANGNGTLEPSEVASTQEVCNGAAGTGTNGKDGTNGTNGTNGDAGANGAPSLINTTVLVNGDAACPNGGVKIDYGNDDGAGGGIAGNGLLETGEIRGTRNVCNGGQPYYGHPLSVPTGADGTFHLWARGGRGGTGQGGSGSTIYVQQNSGTLGGNVAVFKNGTLDAGFTVPSVTLVPGANPMKVEGDAGFTLNSFDLLADGVTAGERYFQVAGDSRIYSQDAGIVTSLWVANNSTLTVTQSTSEAQLSVQNQLQVDGTLVATPNVGTTNATSLNLSAFQIVFSPSSSVALKGDTGGSGGNLTLQGNAGVIQQGTIDLSGSSGASGGSYSLYAQGPCYSTGNVTTNGGSNPTGTGGAAGSIGVNCGSIYLSGTLNFISGGGQSSSSNTQANFNSNGGPFISSAALIGTGGDSTGDGSNGGNGASISIQVASGDLTFNGRVNTTGGSSASGSGGSGGSVSIQAYESTGLHVGEMRVGGNIDTSGGSGLTGGRAGDINIRQSPSYYSHGEDLTLYGYSEFDVSGAPSDSGNGGSAGSVYISTFSSRVQGRVSGPSGIVANSAKVIARGGDGVFGGYAGTVRVQAQTDYPFGQPNDTAINFGDIDVTSGNSSGPGVNGSGAISIYAMSKVENHGALTANGGTQSGGGGPGGNSGNITLTSYQGPVTNTGALRANGGSATGNGGYGGSVYCYGTLITNSAPISATGGNSAGVGGSGGYVQLYSTSAATANTGAITVAGGAGSPAGDTGGISIDGVVKLLQ